MDRCPGWAFGAMEAGEEGERTRTRTRLDEDEDRSGRSIPAGQSTLEDLKDSVGDRLRMRPALRDLKSCCADTIERKFPLIGLWEDTASPDGDHQDPSTAIGAVWSESSLRRELSSSCRPLYGPLLAMTKMAAEILRFRRHVPFNITSTTVIEDLVDFLTCYALRMKEEEGRTHRKFAKRRWNNLIWAPIRALQDQSNSDIVEHLLKVCKEELQLAENEQHADCETVTSSESVQTRRRTFKVVISDDVTFEWMGSLIKKCDSISVDIEISGLVRSKLLRDSSK
eukprot:765967-Hanusia_phi.AAC.1